MNTLSKGADLRAFRKTTKVEFSDIGVSVRLRELSAIEIQELGKSKDSAAWLAGMIIDDAGELVFGDDPQRVLELSASILGKLVNEALTLNGTSRAAVEEAVKNLPASQPEPSVSV